MKTLNLNPLLPMAAAALLVSCSPPPGTTPPPPQVTVARPRVATVTNWDEYPGHIEAVERVEIRPRVAGYIDSIHFRDGSEVKAGDLLFVIDPKPYQAELDQARAERLRGETRLDLTRNDLQRAESLRGTKAISDEEYDTRSKAVREAEAALAAVEAAETAAQLDLAYTRVQAPISGRIGRRLVTVGNLVQGGGPVPATLLATLISQDPVYCYFDADEASFLRYRENGPSHNPGGSAAGVLACELALVNEPAFPHQGQVDFFDNQVDEETGTIRMRGIFPNPDRALVPGMFARVRVPAGPPVEALLVPAVAIGSDQGLKFVLVVNQDNQIESRSVQVDRQHGLMRAVTAGLTPEDRVVINGMMKVRPGMRVKVMEGSVEPVTPGAEAGR